MYNEKEAMDRRNAVLQRKLEEVESRIGRLLEHPPSTYIHDDDDDRMVSLYARKIDFIKNMLTAEMNSRSPHRPENLNRMATRLSILEKAFVDWASHSRFSKVDETFANGVESADNNGAVDKCPDTSASGSCTESWVVDEEFEEESNDNEKVGEKKQEDRKEKTVGEVKVETTEEKGRRKQGGDMVRERKSQAKRNSGSERKEEGPALAGESKDEAIDEKKAGKQRKKKGEMTKARRERNREAELVGLQKAEINLDDERRKRKQQCRGVRSWMAMGCAAIAGFTSALILVALANISYVEETVYLVPT